MAKPAPLLTPEQQVKKNLDKAKYGWTKWGGANHGLVKENLTDEWSCQACGETQTNELPPYMFEFVFREYIRICSKCHYLRLKDHIEPTCFDELLTTVRHQPLY